MTALQTAFSQRCVACSIQMLVDRRVGMGADPKQVTMHEPSPPPRYASGEASGQRPNLASQGSPSRGACSPQLRLLGWAGGASTAISQAYQRKQPVSAKHSHPNSCLALLDTRLSLDGLIV